MSCCNTYFYLTRLVGTETPSFINPFLTHWSYSSKSQETEKESNSFHPNFLLFLASIFLFLLLFLITPFSALFRFASLRTWASWFRLPYYCLLRSTLDCFLSFYWLFLPPFHTLYVRIIAKFQDLKFDYLHFAIFLITHCLSFFSFIDFGIKTACSLGLHLFSWEPWYYSLTPKYHSIFRLFSCSSEKR